MPHKQTFRKSKKNKLSKLSKNTNKKSKYSKLVPSHRDDIGASVKGLSSAKSVNKALLSLIPVLNLFDI